MIQFSLRKLKKLKKTIYWFHVGLAIIFFGLYVILLQNFVEHPPYGFIAFIGYYIHTYSGLVYLMCGFIQFNGYIRKNYQKIHRISGYMYFSMVFVMVVGIIVLLVGGALAKESAVISTLTVAPLWIWFNYLSYKAIKRGDVATHRKHNLRCFVIAYSIIYMRPGVLIVSGIMGYDAGNALRTVIWWIWAWALIMVESWLYLEDTLTPPSLLYPKGKYIVKETRAPVWNPVNVINCQELNARTICLKLQHKYESSSMFMIYPGQHIALKVDTLQGKCTIRSYSPVTTENDFENGIVELLIRLVPQGDMSKHISTINREFKENPQIITSRLSIAYQKQRYFYTPSYAHLIMIAAGSGITPFMNIIRGIVNDKQNNTKITLLFINKNEQDLFLKPFPITSDQLNVVYKYDGSRVGVKDIVGLVVATDVANSQFLISGPKQFVKDFHLLVQKQFKVKDNQIYSFGYSDS